MTADNTNGNTDAITSPHGHRVSHGAQLIAEGLIKGFDRLKKEMDDNQKLTEKKMERRENFITWVISVFLIFSAFALPSMVVLIYDLQKSMKEMTSYMKTMNDGVFVMKGKMAGMSDDMMGMRKNISGMDKSMTAMNNNIDSMRGECLIWMAA